MAEELGFRTPAKEMERLTLGKLQEEP